MTYGEALRAALTPEEYSLAAQGNEEAMSRLIVTHKYVSTLIVLLDWGDNWRGMLEMYSKYCSNQIERKPFWLTLKERI